MNNFEKFYPTKETIDIAPEHCFDVNLAECEQIITGEYSFPWVRSDSCFSLIFGCGIQNWTHFCSIRSSFWTIGFLKKYEKNCTQQICACFIKNFKYWNTMKYERNRHDCSVYITLLCFYKGYGYCNHNFVEAAKVKIYIYNSFWSFQLQEYCVWWSNNSQPSYVHLHCKMTTQIM